MPYVPYSDRPEIDKEVVICAEFLSKLIDKANIDEVYLSFFKSFDATLRALEYGAELSGFTNNPLANVTFNVAKKYNYDGAHLGEDNYAITRLIQVLPQIMVKKGIWKEELRYWIYAKTVDALVKASATATCSGLAGVFEDIKDEYKRRVNPSYEAAQIIKSHDCYTTPYYNKLVEVVTKEGKTVGHFFIDMLRSPETIDLDVLPGKIVLD